MQRPILKDGIVVNVVEIDEGTAIVTKAEHRQMSEAEEAEYANRLLIWQGAVKAAKTEISEVEVQLFMVTGMAAAAKADARNANGGAAAHLDRILVAEAEVEAWQAKLVDAKAMPLPERPRLERALRWIYPEGCLIGPEGGQIGDSWNGIKYTRPADKGALTPQDAA